MRLLNYATEGESIYMVVAKSAIDSDFGKIFLKERFHLVSNVFVNVEKHLNICIYDGPCTHYACSFSPLVLIISDNDVILHSESRSKEAQSCCHP